MKHLLDMNHFLPTLKTGKQQKSNIQLNELDFSYIFENPILINPVLPFKINKFKGKEWLLTIAPYEQWRGEKFALNIEVVKVNFNHKIVEKSKNNVYHECYELQQEYVLDSPAKVKINPGDDRWLAFDENFNCVYYDFSEYIDDFLPEFDKFVSSDYDQDMVDELIKCAYAAWIKATKGYKCYNKYREKVDYELIDNFTHD